MFHPRTVPQYFHIALTNMDAVHIGGSVELTLIILQVWQGRQLLNFTHKLS
jgi:hypothetical protein